MNLEIVHLSTEKKSVDKRIRVQPFLDMMHLINRQATFKEICQDLLNDNELLFKKLAGYH